jgi:S1-C subfamily serine protease
MKYLIPIICFFCCSCSIKFNTALLTPNDISINPRFTNLAIPDASSISVKSSYNPETTLGKLESLIEEDFEENILKFDKSYKGYIIPEINANILVNGHGWAFLTGFTLGTLNLLGMPWNGFKISLNTEFTIRDINNNKVWKKRYFQEKQINVGFYYNAANQNCADNETLILLRSILDNFKRDLQKDLNEINEKLERSNPVNVKKVTNNEWAGNGSGFFISKSGYIVTNNHVVDGASKIEVEFKFQNELKSFNADVIKVDKTNDLAIIKINDSQFSNINNIPYNFKTRSVDVGTEIFALGYPLALSIMGKDIKFTDGKISSKTGIDGDITTYQIQVPIQPGNSGGPLFDYQGNLIGITSSTINRKLDLTENVNYAIKTNYLLNLIDVLPSSFNLPSSKILSTKPLTEQIKILSDYVVLIKVR